MNSPVGSSGAADSGNPALPTSSEAFPYRRVLRRTAQQGHTEIIGPFPQLGMQKKALEPDGSKAAIPTISLAALLYGDAETASGGTWQH